MTIHVEDEVNLEDGSTPDHGDLVDQWDRFISRIGVCGILKFSVGLADDETLGRRIAVSLPTEERDSGGHAVVSMFFEIDGPPTAERVRRMMQIVMMHELNESILIDGVRVFDPHAGDLPRPGCHR